jgi:hypothetical protein
VSRDRQFGSKTLTPKQLAGNGSVLAARLERLPDPVAQIKEMFEAERSVIEAELDLTRAYRQDLLNELLLTMQM